MATEKDRQQDELIRQNAEHIRRNEEALQRQTEALEKIRDHYFPPTNLWKNSLGLFLKAVGAVTVAAGLLETGDWYWNTRQSETMAKESASVAQRLLFEENDPVGARRFLERAVELDGTTVRYRIVLAYVKGMATVAELFDLGRPLTAAERERVDACLAEAVFLQQAAPDDAMPHVLAAQAYLLRGESKEARASVERAIALNPSCLPVRTCACAVLFAFGDYAAAREQLKVAERLNAGHLLVQYWQGMLAAVADRDWASARATFAGMARRAPKLALAHLMVGKTLLDGDKPDLTAARAAFAKALDANPKMKKAMLLMSASYEREDNLILAKLWLDQAIVLDATCMEALTARARINGKTGAWKDAVEDLSSALALSPFQAVLYRERGKARREAGDEAGATADFQRAAALARP